MPVFIFAIMISEVKNMVDTLIPAEDGQPITAETTNLNNNFLLNAINSAKQSLDSSLKSAVVSLQTNIKSVQQTLQKNIDNLANDINSKLNTRTFVQKELALKIGSNSLASYLPNDGKQYNVLVNAYQDGGYTQLTAASDILTTPRVLYHTDNDAGRNSIAAALCYIPVGIGRTITMVGGASWIKLCGYYPV